MDEQELRDKMLDGIAQGCMKPVAYLVAVVLVLLLAGCKTKTIIEERIVPEVHYVDKVQVQRDSVYLHDSIYQTQYLQGDTIVRYKYTQKTLFRDRVSHDTIVKVDSIPFEVKTLVERTKTNYAGWWAFSGLLALILIIYIIHRWLKR